MSTGLKSGIIILLLVFLQNISINKFEVVSGRRVISLTTKQMSLEGDYDLLHRSITTIARGDETSIMKLKSIQEDLVSNEQIGACERCVPDELKDVQIS